MFRVTRWAWIILLGVSGCHHLTDNSSLKSDSLPHKENQQMTVLNEQKVKESNHAIKPSTFIDFSEASRFVLNNSNSLLAKKHELRAKQLEAEALDSLLQPIVIINGSVGHYHAEKDISTTSLRNRLKNAVTNISTHISSLGGQVPPEITNLIGSFPSSINLSRQKSFANASISALYPLYTGGREGAIQSYASGRVDTQESEVAETKEELQTLLVKRYFLVQLAKTSVNVRKKALKAVKGHDHAAQRMLDVGLISMAERLQGEAALSDAKFQLEKAKDNLSLSQRAFDSLLQSRDIFPATALFVNHEPLSPLSTFKEKARLHYPAFNKITAKEKQANALKKLRDAAWHPSVSAFGTHELDSGAKNWAIGLSARWTLNSPVNRAKMQQASLATLEQISAIRLQAQNDVDLLVEKSWLTVNDTVARFDSLVKEEKLAKEVLRLRKAGFKEGLNTVIDVNDAEANLTKTQTMRAKIAYEYVVVLAELLAAVGEPDTFAEYIASADTRIEE